MTVLKKSLASALVLLMLAGCSGQGAEDTGAEPAVHGGQDETQTDLYMSAYDKDRNRIRPDGLGRFSLGGSIQELEAHLPVAELSPIEGEDGVGGYLMRLAESGAWDLRADVLDDEVVALTFLSSTFYTDKGIRPQESRLADVVKNYRVDHLVVPDSGRLYVGVRELPRVTFIFEDEALLKFGDGAQPKVNEIPATLQVKSISISKALQ